MDDGRDATVYNGPPFPPNEQNSDNPKCRITLIYFIYFYLFYFRTTMHSKKSTACLRPQIAKATRGGRSYTQSVVKPVLIKLQQY